ncbi:MAG TPA: hypothetical protein VMN36_03515 [Verrucomicrobiales bacterium]|nr:hypothetical protein [Verrucomicrobiales bacterium]
MTIDPRSSRTLDLDWRAVIRELEGLTQGPDAAEIPRIYTNRSAIAGTFANGAVMIVGKRETEQLSEDRVPVLGRIPVLCHVFRKRGAQRIQHLLAARIEVRNPAGHGTK